jgi:hypothetical protein
MATEQRTKNTHSGRKGVNVPSGDFGDEAIGAQGTGAGDSGEIEPVIRKVLSDLLTEASEELGSPNGEPPTEGRPSRMLSGAGAGGPVGTPNDNEALPPEVSEAVQAVMQELSPEQAEALASLFEAMGQAPEEAMGEALEEEDQEAGSVGFSSAELQSLERATAQGVGTVLKWLIKWFMTSGRRYLRPAVQAAKRGIRAFMKWKKNLPWPVRVAISGLGPVLVEQLVKWLASQAGVAEARQTRAAASAGAEPGEPNETEEAVRRVLADLLTKASDELESDEETPQSDEDEPARVERFADLELESAEEAKAEGERLIRPPRPIGPNHPVIIALRAVRKLYREAVKAAKGGPRSFNRWVNRLSNFNPIKWAIKGLPSATRAALIAFLARQREGVVAGGRTAAAAAGETDPAEIEQVVRKVLSQALAGSQSSSAVA